MAEEFKIPEGTEKISGAEFPTAEAQKAAYSDIQQDPTGTFLYGTKIQTPEVPVYNKEEIKTNIQTSLGQEGIMDKTANKAFADAVLRYKEGRDAKPEEIAGTVGDMVERYGIGDLAPGFGVKDETVIKTEEEEQPKDIMTQIDETFQGLFTGVSDIKKETGEQVDLEGKSNAIVAAEKLANDLRTMLQTQQIGDIKEQDVVKGMPLLTSQIQGELNNLSREQKLDLMITQQNYNNSLVGVQIAQGNYDRARSIVSETAEDWYNAQALKLDYLQMQKGWKDEERARYEQEIDYERNLRLQGFSYIEDTDTYNKLVKDFGVTADTFNQFFFKDPANGKIYLRPKEVEEVAGVDLTTDFKNYQLAGGEVGTGMTFTEWQGKEKPGFEEPKEQSEYMKQTSNMVLQTVDELIGQLNSKTTGWGALAFGKFPGSEARTFNAQLDTLKGNIGFAALTAMREASKTGGALGQVSDREIKLLTSTLGALDQLQSAEQLKVQLNKVKESVGRWNNAVIESGGNVSGDMEDFNW